MAHLHSGATTFPQPHSRNFDRRVLHRNIKAWNSRIIDLRNAKALKDYKKKLKKGLKRDRDKEVYIK